LSRRSFDYLQNPDSEKLDSDLTWLSAPGNHLVTVADEGYPALLKSLSGHPFALFVRGDPNLLWQPQLAVVGSRNPTAGGIDNARAFADALARRGLVITSGLAEGIDSVAHSAALDAGAATIAVMGTGIDRIYPAGNRELAARIAEEGAVITEFPPGTPARPGHFPARNRIISGLSLGTLVVEAGLNSGSLITARLASEQGREIFAIPGSIHNPMAKGCHRLIRDGAKLVQTANDIIEELQPMAAELASGLREQLDVDKDNDIPIEAGENTPNIAEDPDYTHLLSCLGYDPKPVDQIIEQSGLTTSAVSSMLLMLELRGMVEVHREGNYSRK
jgi:DNA processing protein